jgi:hypothetical protein
LYRSGRNEDRPVDSPSKGQCFRTPTLAAPKLHRSETRLPDSTSRPKSVAVCLASFRLQNEDDAGVSGSALLGLPFRNLFAMF